MNSNNVSTECGKGRKEISGSKQSNPSKDSFNRFDERLTENILSYLIFSEKVMFETMCKLWQKVIYNKQKELQLNRSGDEEDWDTMNKLMTPLQVVDFNTGAAHNMGLNAIKKSGLKSLLRKCESIEIIYFYCYCDEEVLEIIAEYCPRLKEFQISTIGLTDECLVKYGIKCGHQLERIELYNTEYTDFVLNFFKYCTNAKDVYIPDLNVLIREDRDYLPNFQVMFPIVLNSTNLHLLTIITTKYSKVLKYLMIKTEKMATNQLKDIINELSKLKSIDSLSIDLNSLDQNIDNIDKELINLAESCLLIKKLDLTLKCEGLAINRLMYSLGNFKQLVKLEIYLEDYKEEVEGSIKCFELCCNLKELELSVPTITEDFFEDIDKILPKLTHLGIECETEITNKFIDCISNLKELKELDLGRPGYYHKYITDDSICQLLNKCHFIELFRFSSRPNITHKTIDALISYALRYSKRKIQLNCSSAQDVDDNHIQHINIENYFDIIPNNLQLLGDFW